jgi:hypothetical protein
VNAAIATQIIVSVTSIAVAGIGAWASIQAAKSAAEAARSSIKNGEKLQEVHGQFNDRMDQFLALKDAKSAIEVTAAHAQGMKDEKERYKD